MVDDPSEPAEDTSSGGLVDALCMRAMNAVATAAAVPPSILTGAGVSGTITSVRPNHSSQAVTGLNKVILPVIRRVMPSLIASQIIGVSPMSGPSGLIFSLRARYGHGTNPI